MKWMKPRIVEIAVGLEINSYACASSSKLNTAGMVLGHAAMRVIVLGSAAGGGFPQWNSNAPACRRARRGDPAVKPRTQASIAVSRDGAAWFLLNASPDIREQIAATEALWPNSGLRSSPIAGVALTGGDVDAVAGLLTLRERHRFAIYATPRSTRSSPRTRSSAALVPDCVERHTRLDSPSALVLPMVANPALRSPHSRSPARCRYGSRRRRATPASSKAVTRSGSSRGAWHG